MKKIIKSILYTAIGVALFTTFSHTVFAQTSGTDFVLSFDTSELAVGESASDIYVTFAGSSASMTLGGTAIDFSGGITLIDGSSYVTSQSYSLATIEADGGVIVTSATSMDAIISYGSDTGFSEQITSPTTPDQTIRYSQVEFTYAPASGTTPASGQADLTNINQYGGSLALTMLAGTGTESYEKNTLSTANEMSQLVTAVGGTSSTAVQTGSGYGPTGSIVRVNGPSQFITESGSTPYPTFNNTLGQLYVSSSNGATPVATLQNGVPGVGQGGSGATGIGAAALTNATYGIVSGDSYNLNYYFSAYVTSTTVAGSGTFYGVTFSGSAVLSNANSPVGTTSGTISGISFTVVANSGSSGGGLTNYIYGQSPTAAGVVITQSGSGWNVLSSAFPTASGTTTAAALLEQMVGGDFTEGLLTGLVGSTATSTYLTYNNQGVVTGTVSEQIGQMTSKEWFQNRSNAYQTGTSGLEVNPYGAIIAANSQEWIAGSGTVNGMVLYTNPYDDRFSNGASPDLNFDSNTTNMVVTLEEVPEPSALFLILAGGLGVVFLFRYYKQHRMQNGESN